MSPCASLRRRRGGAREGARGNLENRILRKKKDGSKSQTDPRRRRHAGGGNGQFLARPEPSIQGPLRGSFERRV